VFDPFNPGEKLSAWQYSPWESPAVPLVLSLDNVNTLQTWVHHIGRRDSKPLEVAIRRLLMATMDRSNPADRLIDAVIGWESLFGRSTELSFRIAGAIAWLLEDNYDQRVALLAEAQEIYRKRGTIAHGGSHTSSELQHHASRAVELLVLVLRKLYSDRPELIGDRERAKRLLMGR
jgi:hypothetical protein